MSDKDQEAERQARLKTEDEKKRLSSSLHDLDRDGDVDIGDAVINDLDRDGRIDLEDREQHDLDNDNDIDAADHSLAAKQGQSAGKVGQSLGWGKDGGNWQRPDTQRQQQSVSGPRTGDA